MDSFIAFLALIDSLARLLLDFKTPNPPMPILLYKALNSYYPKSFISFIADFFVGLACDQPS